MSGKSFRLIQWRAVLAALGTMIVMMGMQVTRLDASAQDDDRGLLLAIVGRSIPDAIGCVLREDRSVRFAQCVLRAFDVSGARSNIAQRGVDDAATAFSAR